MFFFLSPKNKLYVCATKRRKDWEKVKKDENSFTGKGRGTEKDRERVNGLTENNELHSVDREPVVYFFLLCFITCSRTALRGFTHPLVR